MAEAFCDRCQLPLISCPHGREPDFAALAEIAGQWEERSAGLGPWTQALYSGRCAACGRRWPPGEMIRASDEDAGWLCGECGQD